MGVYPKITNLLQKSGIRAISRFFSAKIFPAFIFMALFLLVACGQKTHGFYDKRQEPTYLKIDALDLLNNKLSLRIEYRSYKEKILQSLACNIKLNDNSELELNQQTDLSLASYSTEIINFTAISISQSKVLFNQKEITYQLSCDLTFDKGKEYSKHHSVLHLVPASKHQYR